MERGIFDVCKNIIMGYINSSLISLYLLKKENIKRYMPVALFISLIATIIFEIAYTYEWWTINKLIFPWGYITEVSFTYGLFAVVTIWIFGLTFHNFWLYIFTNLGIDALFAFFAPMVLQELGIATFKNITNWQIFLLCFTLSFVIYGYQRWQEGVLKTSENID